MKELLNDPKQSVPHPRSTINGIASSESSHLVDETVAGQMRYALRRFAKAVVVITTRHEGRRHAMAATAVSELSMEPPSMLICVNNSASLHPVLSAGAHFAINILQSDHGPIAAACSGGAKGEARFQTGTWTETATGVPRLSDAQASFVCRNVQQIAFGSHSIFIGQVEDVFVGVDVDPLIYVDGHYTKTGSKV
jgi:flavin reductase (DIM6/NTAB) family NADH-FMN oxidoreductase RutF